jgi:hypothetical protein
MAWLAVVGYGWPVRKGLGWLTNGLMTHILELTITAECVASALHVCRTICDRGDTKHVGIESIQGMSDLLLRQLWSRHLAAFRLGPCSGFDAHVCLNLVTAPSLQQQLCWCYRVHRTWPVL